MKKKKKIVGKYSSAKSIIGFKFANSRYKTFLNLAKKSYADGKSVGCDDSCYMFYGLSDDNGFWSSKSHMIIIEDEGAYNRMCWFDAYGDFHSESTKHDRSILDHPMKFRYKDIS